jgi:hypothetical protein
MGTLRTDFWPLYLGVALSSRADVSVGYTQFAIDQRTAEVLAKEFSKWALLYTYAPSLPPSFVGRGVISGLATMDAPNMRLCVLDQVERFIVPVDGGIEAVTPGLRRYIRLEDARYEAIVADALANGRAGLSEADAEYQSDVARPGLYSAVYRQVLEAWDYRCALTGQRYKRVPGLHPDLEVVPIKPMSVGGEMHVRNFIPIAVGLKASWMSGGVGVGADGDLLLSLNRLDAKWIAVLAKAKSIGSPKDMRYRPDWTLLAWHKAHVLGS